MKSKIAFILPYFGKLPLMANYYFQACVVNSNIDFLVFTDQRIQGKIPINVRIINYNLKQFNSLASTKLGVSSRIANPYKLCDYKPMYGHIFEDYLVEYSHWGYTDLDMILGKVDYFINENILNSFDIITARENSFAGNFTLFRNSSTNKHLYQCSDNWKDILLKAHYVYSFPECFKETGRPAGRGLGFMAKTLNIDAHLPGQKINDINEIVKSDPGIRTYFGNFILSDELFRTSNITNWEVKWKDGIFRETCSGKEGLYFHFFRIKNSKSFKVESLKSVIDFNSMRINSDGIFIDA